MLLAQNQTKWDFFFQVRTAFCVANPADSRRRSSLSTQVHVQTAVDNTNLPKHWMLLKLDQSTLGTTQEKAMHVYEKERTQGKTGQEKTD